MMTRCVRGLPITLVKMGVVAGCCAFVWPIITGNTLHNYLYDDGSNSNSNSNSNGARNSGNSDWMKILLGPVRARGLRWAGSLMWSGAWGVTTRVGTILGLSQFKFKSEPPDSQPARTTHCATTEDCLSGWVCLCRDPSAGGWRVTTAETPCPGNNNGRCLSSGL